MATALFYYMVIVVSVLMSISLFSYRTVGNGKTHHIFFSRFKLKISSKREKKNGSVVLLLIATLPIILITTLRYGIGQDYFSYEDVYNSIHNVDFFTYLRLHLQGTGDFYVEPAYYFLNIISPNYIILQLLIFILLCINICRTEKLLPKKSWFVVYIFNCCNFVYSLNATRYVLALSFLMVAIAYLLRDNKKSFLINVLIAALFHKTLLLALVFLFLKGGDKAQTNKKINAIVVAASLFATVSIPLLLHYASRISIFERYFNREVYQSSESINLSFMWLMHILPVAVTLLFVPRDRFATDKIFVTITRIYLLEIPFRFIAFYNVWYGRLARIPQVIEVFLVPYILGLNTGKNKKILEVYYIVWYAFYFFYYYFMDGAADYRWIFGR